MSVCVEKREGERERRNARAKHVNYRKQGGNCVALTKTSHRSAMLDVVFSSVGYFMPWTTVGLSEITGKDHTRRLWHYRVVTK